MDHQGNPCCLFYNVSFLHSGESCPTVCKHSMIFSRTVFKQDCLSTWSLPRATTVFLLLMAKYLKKFALFFCLLLSLIDSSQALPATFPKLLLTAQGQQWTSCQIKTLILSLSYSTFSASGDKTDHYSFLETLFLLTFMIFTHL